MKSRCLKGCIANAWGNLKTKFLNKNERLRVSEGGGINNALSSRISYFKTNCKNQFEFDPRVIYDQVSFLLVLSAETNTIKIPKSCYYISISTSSKLLNYHVSSWSAISKSVHCNHGLFVKQTINYIEFKS